MKVWSLQRKIGTAISVISILTIGFYLIYIFYSFRAIEEEKKQLVINAAKSAIEKIDRNLFERYGDVQAFAISEGARGGNSEKLLAFMNEMMAIYAPVYDMMLVINTAGKVVATNTVDKRGNKIDPSSLFKKDFFADDWFKEVVSIEIKNGETIVKDLHRDAEVAQILGHEGRVMKFIAPIRHKSTSEIIGYWCNIMSWDDVVKSIIILENDRIISENVEEGYFYLLDKNGMYLHHPEGNKIELNVREDDLEKMANYGLPILGSELHFSALNSTSISAVVSSKGYSSYPGQGWKMIAQVPEDDHLTATAYKLATIVIVLAIVANMSIFFLLEKTTKSIIKINREILSEIENLNESSQEINASSQKLAESTTEQAAALEQTAASIEELTAMVKKNAENAQRSQKVSLTSRDAADRGKISVEQMLQAMEAIHGSQSEIISQVETSNHRLGEMVNIISEIGNKTKVINEIVFQTKLLSFNASVEAARAGEHGKSFAIVAEEVGSLAKMSGDAAKGIADLLQSSIQKVENIVQDTKNKVEKLLAQGKEKANLGTSVAKQCSDNLAEIVNSVDEVNNMISEISMATKEQELGIIEINKAMNQIDQVTHENAATSQKAASYSIQISQQSDALIKLASTIEETLLGKGNIKHVKLLSVKKSSSLLPVIAMDSYPLEKNTNLNKKNIEPDIASPQLIKRAVGSDYIPSESDARFKDI